MYYVILAIHLLVALLLGVVVLLQRSKGNGLAGAFGGVGAGEAMFGTHGVTTMLHKATIYLAIFFMVTSLSLVYMTAQRGGGGGEGPARATTGRPVLPVGATDVAAPDAPTGTTTLPTTTEDGIVPAESDDAIVPEPAEGEGSDETGEGGGTTEGGTEEGSGEGGN